MKEEARMLAMLALLPLIGMFGFIVIERWSAFDALYMSVITLTTVGYGEVHPLSPAGRVFVMFYLVAGLGAFLFAVTQLGELAVRSGLGAWTERRRMSGQVTLLTNHFIVCGCGRMGRTICQELAAKALPFVVIERGETGVELCRQQGWPFIAGDATDDRILTEAGVASARGLAAALSSDADNLYLVISARLLSPKLQIVARADDEKSVVKLQKAGANRVISLYATSAMKAAQLLSNPELEDFLEVLNTPGAPLDLVEIHVDEHGAYVGKTLEQAKFRAKGLVLVALRRRSGELVFSPPPSHNLVAGDMLIVLGRPEALNNLLQPQ